MSVAVRILVSQLALALVSQLSAAQTTAPSHALLDVPFVAQTPELCGGAAVSMVFRYWGRRDVFPQDFAPLVSQNDGGIFTGVLAKAVTDRGWTALVEPATAGNARARVHAELDRGRPIIALIQVAPRVYHYVVIVGSTDTDVVFHDPARAPFRVLDWTTFDRDWSAANRWMMVALPASAPAGAPAGLTPADSPATVAPTPCSPLVKHAVDAALAGQTDDAEKELAAAMRLCPTDASAWRETAGLRFTQKRWAEANRLATTATRLAPADAYAWELAATSRYLMGDPAGALAAWNRIGQPHVDAVNVRGAERTRVPAVVGAMGLTPRSLLTPDAFGRASRRLRDLPVAAAADIQFEPVAGGLANVNAVIVERRPWPRGRAGLLMLGARTAAQREVRVETAGLAGAGESAFAAWRFANRRPRVMAGLAFPSPRWLPGITTFSAMWEEQTYAAPVIANDTPLKETRRRMGLQISDWASGWLKWQAGAAIDRFDRLSYFGADGSVSARLSKDRAAVTASAGGWLPLSGARRFATGGARVQLRSTADAARPTVSVLAEFQRASGLAPFALWPGAGIGAGADRASTLRGHQLVDDGFVTGDAFGRELVNGTIEYAQPVGTIRTAAISIAGFLDAARASSRHDGLAPSSILVDAGAGLRVRLPGRLGGFRFDVAHTLGDGRLLFSAGWIAAWPK